MKFIAFGYPFLVLASLGVSAQMPSEYDALYGKCVDKAGPINNGIVAGCSGEISGKAKKEITNRYKSIYARLLTENPDDAQSFSRRKWRGFGSGTLITISWCIHWLSDVRLLPNEFKFDKGTWAS